MVRVHYSARVGGARNRGAAYRAPDGRTASREVLVIPVTGDLVECPVCGGGVKTILSAFADPGRGIGYKSPVYGAHRFGGEPGGRQDKCAGSHSALS